MREESKNPHYPCLAKSESSERLGFAGCYRLVRIHAGCLGLEWEGWPAPKGFGDQLWNHGHGSLVWS